MKNLILTTGFLLMMCAAAAAQQMPAPSPKPTTPMMKTKAPKTPKMPKAAKTKPTDDAGIKTCIDGKLAKSKMAGENFQDSVSGGTATFTGMTKVPGHKGGVSGIGKSCGAKTIVNNITVEGKTSVPKTPKTPKTKTTMTTPAKSN